MAVNPDWLSIIFTSPESQPNEGERITAFLRTGAADYVHIRKPDWSREMTADLIRSIPIDLHPRLTLHDCFELLEEFPLIGGVHINSRNPEAPRGNRRVSRSCHTLSEIEDMSTRGYAYITLSPVFDSISKQGYSSAFNLGDLKDKLTGKRVVALGGVTPRAFPMLQRAGFIGGAMLGYAWGGAEVIIANIIKYKALTTDFALQFITNAATAEETLWQVATAYDYGCRWVQVRMKDAPEQEVEKVIEAAVNLRNGRTLLVDDNVALAKKYGIGVHLGKTDMPPAQARDILGTAAIIGSTCNTEEDINNVISWGASDYVGLGPFRFTHTKKNLAPVLGLKGYEKIIEAGDHRLPIVAIGGITCNDIADLLHTGVDGIAVSGAIMKGREIVTSPAKFLDEIAKHRLHKIPTP